MNFLQEIIAFDRWKEIHQLSSHEVALWLELMLICNRLGWQPVFSVPNARLQIGAGLSRGQFERARQRLISLGRIEYKKDSRKVNEAGKYKIIPFVSFEHRNKQRNKQQNEQQDKQQNEQEMSIEMSTLNKQETKSINNINNIIGPVDNVDKSVKSYNSQGIEDVNKQKNKVLVAYEQNIGLIKPIIFEAIKDWQEDLPDDVIIEAINQAVKAGGTRRNWSYINGILNNWFNAGVKSLADIRTLQEEFSKKKENKSKKNTSKFSSINTRSYDFKEIEKISRGYNVEGTS